MGRSRAAISNNSSDSSEIEIKVQPRSATTTPPSSGPHRIRPPHRPPPPPKLFRPWVPWLVPFIVVLNIALFVYAMYLNNCPENYDRCVWADVLGRYAFQSTKENPLLGPSAATLLKLGALEVHRVVNEHQVWRLFSCMWLHAGVFHVLANMLSLLFVGIRLEQEFGFVRIGVVYILSGIGGSLLSSLFVRNTISVGASGALFGLLGAMLSELLTNWSIYENKLAALTTLVFIIVINLAVGILPHVDNFAHLGGFVTGFLVGFVVLIRPQYGWVNQRKAPPGMNMGPLKSKYKAYQFLFLFVSLAILTLGFFAGMTLLLADVDGNDHCSWCHYLSCMPTPFWSCESRCTTMQLGSQMNLTCMANQKTGSYVFLDGNNTAELQRLCTELCT